MGRFARSGCGEGAGDRADRQGELAEYKWAYRQLARDNFGAPLRVQVELWREYRNRV